METEYSSPPYRGFLRSGTYPALSERVMRGGGVVVKAAGWFVLVVSAASAGYGMTQRLVTPSTPRVVAAAQHSAQPAQARFREAALSPANPRSSLHKPPLAAATARGTGTDTGAPRAAQPQPVQATTATGALATRPVAAAAQTTSFRAAIKRRSGAGRTPEEAAAARHAETPPADGSASSGEADKPADLIAERAHLLEVVTQVVGAASSGVASSPEPAQARAAPWTSQSQQRSRERHARAASLPLSAVARIAGLQVRGPLSAALVRRSVERVRPALTECYAKAARRAGRNRFSRVRVSFTIDEAGRVKHAPTIEGAELPGFDACLSSAFGKFVCQAPDTGTARAAILIGFTP